MNATEIIRAYYDAFNRRDMDAFFDLLDDNVIHDVNQGGREIGKEAFRRFMGNMNAAYKEELHDMVIFTNEDGTRAAAEFQLTGTYTETSEGFPEAHGQTYKLLVGAFFEIRNGKIARVTNYYNVNDWLRQVRG
ncbi:ketosteroid isomerase-related protein [Gellertiella hungarica]|uniref:Steroid delta-isomerase-like uncharacterized protein n=1 Tax=Gellertiella hungarica TaxID=1572859 RepID=A0A7W6J2I5_9HYPH|nr:ketosteroid isomerase-related protein [Gellertiella hungarica]MBB4063585.1 steroid delta-isomerase-like uncharacterized protein [Gellertiella hungarica]